MKTALSYLVGACLAALSLTGCNDDDAPPGQNTRQAAMEEADGLLMTAAQQTGVRTEQAIQAGKRRQIKSFEDLQQLVAEGSVTNFAGNTGGPNSFVAGLKPTKAIINCSVMAQPTNP